MTHRSSQLAFAIWLMMFMFFCHGLLLSAAAQETSSDEPVSQKTANDLKTAVDKEKPAAIDFADRVSKRADDFIKDAEALANEINAQLPARLDGIDLSSGSSDTFDFSKLDEQFQATRDPEGKGYRDLPILVLASSSMGETTLRQLITDAQNAGAVVVLRGLIDHSIPKTGAFLSKVVDRDRPGGVIVDPRIFRAFGVERVPTFIAAEGPLKSCGSIECVPDAPPHDRLSGNITLEAALEILERSGDQAPYKARASLEVLKMNRTKNR